MCSWSWIGCIATVSIDPMKTLPESRRPSTNVKLAPNLCFWFIQQFEGTTASKSSIEHLDGGCAAGAAFLLSKLDACKLPFNA